MCDYIKRDDAVEALETWAVDLGNPKHILKDDAICALKDLPSVDDVVKAVRCKNCKYHQKDWNSCAYLTDDIANQQIIGDDDYCSFGEVKE